MRDPAISGDLDGEAMRRQTRLTLASAMIGTALEWYDFYIYGTAAALVFNHLFFPSFTPLAGTLAAFASYGVGFLTRPIGGIIFGRIGDKYGRRPVLLYTLALMGLSTTAIGLLPGYASIGIAAPILLTVLRMLQGLGAGAEYGSAVTLSAEKAPPHRRGLYASLSAVGIGSGVLLSAAAFALAQRLPQAAFLSWGWRVPFLVSIVALGVGVIIRLYVTESPVYEALSRDRKIEKSPILTVWRESRRALFVAFGARLAENCAGFFLQVWTLSYVTQTLRVASWAPITGVMLGAGVGSIMIPIFGALSDRIGRRPIYMAGAGLFAICMFPYFWALNTREPGLIIASMVFMIAIVNYSMFSVQAAYFVELFESKTRVTGITFSREISSIFAGGAAPIISSSLLLWFHGRFEPVALYMMAMGVISFLAPLFGPDNRGRSLDPE